MVDEGANPSPAPELPESATAWLEEQASARDVSQEEFLRQLVAAVQTVEEESPETATATDLETLADRVTDLEVDVEEKIEDVRERVVQLKRELDAKPLEEHDHPEIAEELHAAAATAEAAQSGLDELEGDLRALRETTERGFDNYEGILEYHTETTDDIEGKLTRVAAAVVVTRRVVDELGADEEKRDAVDGLKRSANRQGITAADCENCGEDVDIGLLADPACPHCGTSVGGVEPGSGLFGSPTLLAGDPTTDDYAPEVDGPEEEAAVEALLEGDSVSEESETESEEENPRTATDGNGETERGFVFICDNYE